MKTKKYTLKSLQEAAIKIIETYTGIIPDWELNVSARLIGYSKSNDCRYAIMFEHKTNGLCDLTFCGFGNNPAQTLNEFHRAFRVFFDSDNQFEDIGL